MSSPNAVQAEAGRRGVLAWMALNPVAANLMMVLLLLSGLLLLSRQKQEIFPEFELDFVRVHVTYPGAAPTEVERGIVLAVEEAVRGVDGIKTLRSTAAEGMGIINVELVRDAESDRALNDIKSALDRITSFPEAIERPVVSLFSVKMQVVNVAVHGEVPLKTLRQVAEQVRDDLIQDPAITTVELGSAKPYEISIEVPQHNLRKYGLTLGQIAKVVGESSIEVPGGSVRTTRGEVLLRAAERKQAGREYGDIIVREGADGTLLRLQDLAQIRDGFSEAEDEATYNGEPALIVGLYRVGQETPIAVAEAAKAYVAQREGSLPEGVSLSLWNDKSDFLRQRIDLLLNNAKLGLVLVLLILGVFLEPKLAFWVTAGIPISFIGAFVLLPFFGDVSINMISVFGFIVTLGMVVDDAIVVGEAAYLHRSQGKSLARSAIDGVREVARPVLFSITTTCIAFAPLIFVPGAYGKFFLQMPVVVILVLILSLFESLLILPAHLAHSPTLEAPTLTNRILRAFGFVWIYRKQQRFSAGFERFVQRRYLPLLQLAAQRRMSTLLACISLFILAIALVAGGRVGTEFFPKIEQDFSGVEITLPFGTPVRTTREIQQRVISAANATFEDFGGSERYGRGILARIGRIGLQDEFSEDKNREGSAHLTEIVVGLVPAGERDFSVAEFTEKWRARLEQLAGIDTIRYRFTTDVGSGYPIDFRLAHAEMGTLRRASEELATRLQDFAGVRDISDGYREGKEQLEFRLKAEGRALGLKPSDLAHQVRAAFYGAEALRQQRGRDEMRVFVRLPREERESLQTLENLIIRTPTGGEVVLGEAAHLRRSRGYTEINRYNGRRVLNVTADLGGDVNATDIIASVERDIMPELLASYPGLSYELGGDQQAQAETSAGLGIGFAMALVGMFSLMAIAFRSYVQPLIVMAAIPFGLVGAICGHLLLGYKLSMMSFFGIVALSGVVVNDSLIFITSINDYRAAGMGAASAVYKAGVRRFRPILLTSLTTFFGLAPMILETSVQARFLIPMALSLGFGVLFATFIILLLVPALYLLIEDVAVRARRATRRAQRRAGMV